MLIKGIQFSLVLGVVIINKYIISIVKSNVHCLRSRVSLAKFSYFFLIGEDAPPLEKSNHCECDDANIPQIMKRSSFISIQYLFALLFTHCLNVKKNY